MAWPSKVGSLRKQIDKAGTDERAQLRKEIIPLQRELGETVSGVQLYQEIGGLIGRCLLAGLVLWVISQQRLLRIFLIPGVVLIPLVFFYPAAGKLSSGNIDVLKWGIFATVPWPSSASGAIICRASIRSNSGAPARASPPTWAAA